MGRIWIPGGGGGNDLDVITAAAGDIRAGKVIVDKDGEPLTGTLVDNGSWSSSGLAAGASVTIPAGIHDGTGTVTAKSLADQTPGNLAAAKMLSGVYGYSNGTKVTGNIASMAAQTVTPGNTAKTVSCNGKYMTGNVTVSAVANLTAANIKKGVTVGDVTGTWEGYVPGTGDLYKRGANPANFAYGTAFTHKAVGKATFETAQISITGSYSLSTDRYLVLYTQKAFNLTAYTHLNVTFRHVGDGHAQLDSMGLYIGSSLSVREEQLISLTYASIANTSAAVTKSIDISQINATKYLGLRFGGSHAGAGDAILAIDRIWLS